MNAITEAAVGTQVHRAWIKAEPEAIFKALTDPEQIVRYGYAAPVEIELSPGGAYKAKATEAMQAAGAPAVMIEGEVLEVEEPSRLMQTWHALFDDNLAAEAATRLTYEIEPLRHGVSRVTVTHELDGAPLAAAIVGGSVVEAGGGWAFILSDLKSLLETGSAMPSQMG
jgi:uncharacterized protein YndB with AHSA1/START domain